MMHKELYVYVIRVELTPRQGGLIVTSCGVEANNLAMSHMTPTSKYFLHKYTSSPTNHLILDFHLSFPLLLQL